MFEEMTEKQLKDFIRENSEILISEVRDRKEYYKEFLLGLVDKLCKRDDFLLENIQKLFDEIGILKVTIRKITKQKDN